MHVVISFEQHFELINQALYRNLKCFIEQLFTMNPASASSPLSFVLVQEPAKISNIDLSHKHKNFIYSVQFQTRTLVLCTRMENWKYFFVSSFVLLCCLRDAKSEKSDNEIDKTKWTPKLRDPVKVKYFIKSVPASFSSKCRIAV